MAEPWVMDWAEAATAGAGVCGGKGWNLGRLWRYGFPVPTGGVLVASAYAQLMASAGVRESCEGLGSVGALEGSRPDIAERLATVRGAVTQAEWPAGTADGVGNFLRDKGLESVALAIRSSATIEDSAAASFAGIHASVLHVRGLEAVFRAIRVCFSSLWTPQALTYRRRLGISDDAVACAVVLCAMTGSPSGTAGVAFSCDPRTGRRDRIILNAVSGWAEDLVGGRVQPEETTVAVTRGRLELAGGQERRGRLLTEAQAVELSRLVMRAQWALGDGQEPQDVEWVHDGQRFWLVQARPVTRLSRVTFAALAEAPTIWSDANLKEVTPGVVTTLTWSLIQSVLQEILYAPVQAVGGEVPAGMEPVRRFDGRLYFDLGGLQWAFYDCFGLLPADTNIGMGGHQPEIGVPPGSAFRGRRGWPRRWARLRLLWLMWAVARRMPLEILRLHALARELLALDLGKLTNREVLDVGLRAGKAWEFGHEFQLANASAGGWQSLLQAVLERRSPGKGRPLAAALMAASGGVTSAEHGYRLWELGRLARQDAEAQRYLEGPALDPRGWRGLPEGSVFRQGVEGFLGEFGHRAVNELEIANPRWNEDLNYALEQIRLFLGEAETWQPRAAAVLVRAAAQAEVVRVAGLWRPVVNWLAAHARRAAALREAGKSALVALWEPMRAVALEVGRRLAGATRLERPEDVFWLAWIDLESYLRGEWDGRGAAALAGDRKMQAEVWRAQQPPDVIIRDAHGNVAPQSQWREPSGAQRAEHGHSLMGLPVSPGQAQGTACLLRHPSEGGRLRRGDVLVAPTTDPAWTPLFLRASSLVMEVGGYLSHGAIVAREYGIPAVVNVPGVMQAIHDGDQVAVDGDAGRVVI